jgi:Zn-dependent peptidase ImmA (M78 family)/DNA-binding XRE family transcriptional regulator
MYKTDPVNPVLLGKRLTDARKSRGITQEAAAQHLGCSRPTLISIEKGTREAKPDEIVSLASLYGRSVHELVRDGESVSDLQPHLRAAVGDPLTEADALNGPIASMQKFAEDYCRLERLVRSPLVPNYPPEVRLGHADPQQLAEDIADQERRRLGLGDQPVIHLRTLLEVEVGLRILYEDLPSRVAGLFAYSDDFGGVIAVNRKHPAERRRATMVHEYGHLITERYKPGIDYTMADARKPIGERFAEAFAIAFLMPANSVRRRFHQIVGQSTDFQIADLCRLSHYFFVSVEAMTLRLESLRLIPKGIRDHLKRSRFSPKKAAEALRLNQHPQTDDRFSDRYVFLAVQAHAAGQLSEGQLADVLRCGRVDAREIVEKHLATTITGDDGEQSQVQLDFDFSLLGEDN